MKNKIICGDSLEVLKNFEDSYFDSVVTDPPYGLAFMGKKWDYDVPQVELWKEVYRVLKPGGHILSFAGSRTYHRMAVNIEDAGFEIRDMLGWLYGSGFPKSHNIGKAVDKNNGKYKVDLSKFGNYIKKQRTLKGYSRKELDDIMGTSTAVSWWEGRKTGVILPSKRIYTKLKKILNLDNRFDDLIDWKEAEREVVGKKTSGIGTGKTFAFTDENNKAQKEVDITIPKTEQAKQWEGWGTALKPAHEPIVMARKPFNTSVAENVLTHGTGGINIDDCRVGTGTNKEKKEYIPNDKNKVYGKNFGGGEWDKTQGRFPANIIHDGSEEVLEIFPETKQAKSRTIRNFKGWKNEGNLKKHEVYKDDSNSASRFFYCAKASKAERNMGLDDYEEKQVTDGTIRSNQETARTFGANSAKRKNYHPTVKPIKLMEYLVKLVTPKEGIVLEPFAGSGTTLIACKQQGFNYIGIEREQEYCDIAEARLKGVQIQGTLF